MNPIENTPPLVAASVTASEPRNDPSPPTDASIDRPDSLHPASRRRTWVLSLVIAVALGVVGGLLLQGGLETAESSEASVPGLQATHQRTATASNSLPAITAHAADFELPAETEGQLASLRAVLASNPNDLAVRKQLALLLLRNDRLVEAFEESRIVLTAVPDDPDGLFVQAVVRLAMGQETRSLELLEQVLQRYPEHVSAHLVRGKALMKKGHADLAVEAWERGLRHAGGQHPELERLLAEARRTEGGTVTEAAAPVGGSLPSMLGR